MGARRPLLPMVHSETLVPICTSQVNPAESDSSIEVWWAKKKKKSHDYFSSAEQKAVFSMGKKSVSLTSDEEIQNKKQDHLTTKLIKSCNCSTAQFG